MIAVAIGGFFGAVLRYKVSQWNQKKLKQEKFFATFLVNIIGSFLLGIFVGGAYINFITQLIAIGFLGAFTTFSTFSFEVVQLLEARRVKTALLYAISSCIVSITFASIGYLF